MRRADRLFQIVQLLRRRHLTTASQLAERLEVSERTVYRDVRDLSRSGVPVLGEAGVGYRLGRDFEIPPMMFSVDEIQALVLGARMVESWGDEGLRSAARAVLTKVEAVLPPSKRHRLNDTALFSLSFRLSTEVRANVGTLRCAVTISKANGTPERGYYFENSCHYRPQSTLDRWWRSCRHPRRSRSRHRCSVSAATTGARGRDSAGRP